MSLLMEWVRRVVIVLLGMSLVALVTTEVIGGMGAEFTLVVMIVTGFFGCRFILQGIRSSP